MIRISITERGKPPRLLTFSKAQITVGRNSEHDVCLGVQGVSGTHCRLVTQGGVLYIEDLGSTNGTYVNRRRVTAPTPITPADEIVVAVFAIRVVADASAGAPQGSPAGAPGVFGAGGLAASGPTSIQRAEVPPPPHGMSGSAPVVPATGQGMSGSQPVIHSAGHPATTGPQPPLTSGVHVATSGPVPLASGGHPPMSGQSPALPGRGSGPTSLDGSGGSAPADGTTGPGPRARSAERRDDAEWQRQREQIERLAQEWMRQGRRGALLLKGVPLRSAQRWLATGRGRAPGPTRLHQEFIVASRRRGRLRLAGGMFAGVAVLGGLGFGALQLMKAEGAGEGEGDDGSPTTADTLDAGGGRVVEPRPTTDTAKVVAAARAQLQVDPPLAALLGAVAARRAPVEDRGRLDAPAALVVRDALSQIAAETLDVGGPVQAVALDPTGRYAAASTKRRGDPIALYDRGQPGRRRAAVLANHAGRVKHLATSDDGHWLVSADDEGLVMRWDLADRAPASSGVRMESHKVAVQALDLAGTFAASGDASGRVVRWSLEATPVPTALDLSGATAKITDVAVTSDGSLVVATGEDGLGWVWRIAGASAGRPVKLSRPEEYVGAMSSVAVTPDGAIAVVGTSDGLGWLYRPRTRAPSRKALALQGFTQPIAQVLVTPDGGLAALAGGNDIRLYDLRYDDPNTKRFHWRGHDKAILAMDVAGAGPSPEGTPPADAELRRPATRLITGSADQTARIWDVDGREGGATSEVERGHKGAVQAVAASFDGRFGMSGSADGMARVMPLRRWGIAADRRVPGLGGARIARGHAKKIDVIGLGAGARRLITGGDDGTARIWDLTAPGDPEPFVVLGAPIPGRVSAAAIDARGKFVATGSVRGDVRLWDLEPKKGAPGAASLVLPGHTGDITALHFAGRWLVSAALDPQARLWNMKSASPAKAPVVLEHPAEVTASALSADERWLVTTSGRLKQVFLWDLEASNPASTKVGYHNKVHTDAIVSLAVGKDGKWVASGGRGFLLVLRYPQVKRRPVVLRDHEGPVQALAASPDGRLLASGDGAGKVVVSRPLDKHPKETRKLLKGPKVGIRALAWSPDGAWLVGGGDGKAVFAWPVRGDEMGEPVVLEGHENVVAAVAAPMRAGYLVSASWDGTARVWPLDAQDLVPMVCARVGRTLNEAEWAAHVGGDYDDPCG